MKAAHIGNSVVYSWKWYNDSSCKTDPVGEFWSHWEITIEGLSPTVADAYDAEYRLIDGSSSTCQVLLDTIRRQDESLFFGDKFDKEGNWTPCLTKPQKMDTTPFVFVKHLEQTAMQYIENNQLKRNPANLRRGEYVKIWEKS